jgi:hypothetical protein
VRRATIHNFSQLQLKASSLLTLIHYEHTPAR